jgi:hypothetical protein
MNIRTEPTTIFEDWVYYSSTGQAETSLVDEEWGEGDSESPGVVVKGLGLRIVRW